jgi:hypothetical protein
MSRADPLYVYTFLRVTIAKLVDIMFIYMYIKMYI